MKQTANRFPHPKSSACRQAQKNRNFLIDKIKISNIIFIFMTELL